MLSADFDKQAYVIVAIPDQLYRDVQALVRSTPLLLVGSGFSCGFGLPGMSALGAHLSTTVEPLLTSPDAITLWKNALPAILADLEGGLNEIPLAAEGRLELISALRAETAKLISRENKRVEEMILKAAQPSSAAPARLLKRLFNGASQNTDCISVITTNYDTLVELFCDLAGLPIDTGFSGYRRRQVRTPPLFPTTYSRSTVSMTSGKRSAYFDHQPCRNVRLLKPHGSVTWHSTDQGPIEILDSYSEDPKAIVVPGPSKYEDALVNTLFDTMRTEMNIAVNKADALMCIGFGFNDIHLQGMIGARLQAGMPAIILTMGITPNIEATLGKHKHLIAFSDSPNGSMVTIGSDRFEVSEKIWQLECFLKTFVE